MLNFLPVPDGTINALDRAQFIIGLPIAGTGIIIITPYLIETSDDLYYYRSYLLDLQLIKPRHQIPSFLELPTVETSEDLDYYKAYLGRV